MVKHGREPGSSGQRPGRKATDAKSPVQGKRRRGAPQTFSSKLYKILQDAQHNDSSPVGWCLEGEHTKQRGKEIAGARET